MKTTLVIAIASLLLTTSAMGCLQIVGTDLRGRPVDFEMGGPMFVSAEDSLESKRHWKSTAQKLEPKVHHGGKVADFNDYAVALVHLGHLQEAMAILRNIERQHPGRFETASNLGTALELAGENVEALRWIREGIRRNTKEHMGTEWLHVRILEAKLAVAKDPSWLATHSVAGMDFGSEAEPRFPSVLPPGNLGHPVTKDDALNAFEFQLRERLQFVKAPEPIVADLLFDWGNLAAVTQVIEYADAAYSLSAQFGPPRRELFQKRQALVKALLRKAKKEK
jgi:hypothetical protein